MIFFTIFVIIPLIEIGLFMTVGERIGLGPTLLLSLLTAFIGAALVRRQGFNTLMSAHNSLNRDELPVHELFDGICIAVSGALLITPGFFTDVIGFSLLVPPFRAWLRHILKKHIQFETASYGGRPEQPRTPDVIEGEYERLDDEDKP